MLFSCIYKNDLKLEQNRSDRNRNDTQTQLNIMQITQLGRLKQVITYIRMPTTEKREQVILVLQELC